MAEKYFLMQKANGEQISGVHQDAVKDHERLGYKVVSELAPAEAEPVDETTEPEKNAKKVK